MLRRPNCHKRKCRYFLGVSQPDGTEDTERATCSAFPDGIPDEIAYGDNEHLEPIDGDNDIQYEKETT